RRVVEEKETEEEERIEKGGVRVGSTFFFADGEGERENQLGNTRRRMKVESIEVRTHNSNRLVTDLLLGKRIPEALLTPLTPPAQALLSSRFVLLLISRFALLSTSTANNIATYSQGTFIDLGCEGRGVASLAPEETSERFTEHDLSHEYHREKGPSLVVLVVEGLCEEETVSSTSLGSVTRCSIRDDCDVINYLARATGYRCPARKVIGDKITRRTILHLPQSATALTTLAGQMAGTAAKGVSRIAVEEEEEVEEEEKGKIFAWKEEETLGTRELAASIDLRNASFIDPRSGSGIEKINVIGCIKFKELVKAKVEDPCYKLIRSGYDRY
ncbi:hypothetical protein V1478_008655, partial [Vespula squamosa]